MRKYYHLGGVGVECRIENPPLSNRVAAVMGYFGATATTDVFARPVVISISDAAQFVPPADAPVLGTQKQVTIYGIDGNFLITDGTSSALVDPRAERAEVRLAVEPSSPDAVDGSDLLLITVAAIILLRPRGLFALHGACLVNRGEGWLFIGDSDTGKSTLAFTLLQAGWSYLTDDSMLISLSADSKVSVQPLRRDFCMDADARDLFPRIADDWRVQPSDATKRVIPVDRIFRDRHLRHAVPRYLIFPSIVAEPASSLHPVSVNEAVLRLMPQSALLGLSDALMTEQMEVLKALARHTRAFELRAAPDIKGDPDRAAALLSSGVKTKDLERIEAYD